jgi:divalent metal cation (Fe/Co/Zn/Cd) transporter
MTIQQPMKAPIRRSVIPMTRVSASRSRFLRPGDYAPSVTESLISPAALRRAPAALPPDERVRLERRARGLAWAGNAWHLVEFAVAIGAGIAAGSVALIGFGADSLIEGLSGFVIVWLFTGSRLASATAERRAQQIIAGSYVVLAAYIVIESVRDLIGGHEPSVSWVGVALASVTAPTMPLLARAKRDVGRKLSSSATVNEAAQNMLCAYLSIALLVGLLANALLGWWWADPAAALAIAAVAVNEARESWRGDACDCC